MIWVPYYVRHPVMLLQRIMDTEWSENWRSWPHCNGQARCWMHTHAQWCDCRCRWCGIARRFRHLDYSGRGLRADRED